LEVKDVGNKFKVAILAAKRAKQIMKTGKKKLDIEASNPLTVALEEIKEGLVTYETLKEDEQVLAVETTGNEEGKVDDGDVVEEIITDRSSSKIDDANATEEEILRNNLTKQ